MLLRSYFCSGSVLHPRCIASSHAVAFAAISINSQDTCSGSVLHPRCIGSSHVVAFAAISIDSNAFALLAS